MSIKSVTIAVSISSIFISTIVRAGCLEPAKILDQGLLKVESCSYHSTTDAEYPDPRLQKINGSDLDKNQALLIGLNKTRGEPRIFELAPEHQGVILVGKVDNKPSLLKAFFRTKDRNFCSTLIKSNIVDVIIKEMCCDCMKSCIESPCAVGTKNEITIIKSK